MAINSTHTSSQRNARKAEIARLHARGYRQSYIADQLGIKQQAVSYWLKKINAEYAELAADQAAYKQKLLAELAHIKHEAWTEWDKPRENGGNPVYLAQVQKAIEQERAILGLDAPAKVAANTMGAITLRIVYDNGQADIGDSDE